MVMEQGITPCIPSRRNRNKRIPYSKRLYKMRHKVENLFTKLKDWRPIAPATTAVPVSSSLLSSWAPLFSSAY